MIRKLKFAAVLALYACVSLTMSSILLAVFLTTMTVVADHIPAWIGRRGDVLHATVVVFCGVGSCILAFGYVNRLSNAVCDWLPDPIDYRPYDTPAEPVPYVVVDDGNPYAPPATR